jgi:hypothetical protein
MPITELKPNRIEQRCAACEATRELPLTDLTAGIQRGEQVDPLLIGLPACPDCGAREFLIRSPARDDLTRITPGSYGHLHRLLVDRLHRDLVTAGRIVDGADRQSLANLPRTEEDLETWLPRGPRLPPAGSESPPRSSDDT